MLDPANWSLPDGEAVAAAFDPDSVFRRETRIVDHRVSSVDLYSYLKSRFGEPNGFAMLLRSPSVDNLIHWNFTLASGSAILDIRGLDMANEITVLVPPGEADPDWSELDERLLAAFERDRVAMHGVRATLEKWHLFVNPHRVLRVKLERQVARLRELGVDSVSLPDDPQAAGDVPAFNDALGAIRRVFEEAMELCLDIQLSCPVFAESAVDLLMHLLAKPALRSDERLFADQRRRPIDVRVRGLQLTCDGFATGIDGSEEPFKEFQRLMSRRNDRLHGNVDPSAAVGSAVYFDHRFIPLFTTPQGFAQLAIEHALANLDPAAAIRDWEAALGFVELVLSKLEPETRWQVDAAFAQQQLGYRPLTGSIGVILPHARVGILGGAPGHP